jgi:ABC-type lipoprotein release transport system permease subunit
MTVKNLKFWIRTAFVFLFRSGRSTVTLSLMVVMAVAVLIFLSALAVGINDAMIRNSVGLYSGHISGVSLPQSLETQQLKIHGVAGVLKRISIPGMLSNGNNIQTVTMVGVDPAAEFKTTAIWKKIVSGSFLKNADRTVFLSRRIADNLQVRPGNVVQFGSGLNKNQIQFIVSGIYKTGIDDLDRGTAFCPFEALPVKKDTWEAAVFLQEGVEPESVIAQYRMLVSEPAGFHSWKEMMPDLLQLIDLNYISMGVVTVLVFGVVSLGIACAFVIFILKNLREYGIMKAMGTTPGEIGCLIVFEVILMSLAASSIGVLIGVLLVFIASHSGIDLTYFTSHNRYFVVSGVIFPRLTFFSLCLPPTLALFFSLLSAIWPSAIVARKKAADILRSF